MGVFKTLCQHLKTWTQKLGRFRRLNPSRLWAKRACFLLSRSRLPAGGICESLYLVFVPALILVFILLTKLGALREVELQGDGGRRQKHVHRLSVRLCVCLTFLVCQRDQVNVLKKKTAWPVRPDKSRQMSIKVAQNDFTRKMKVFNAFTKIA